MESKTVSPFSFRFIEHESRYELLDAEGKVLDSKYFSGPVGAYLFNALRKHEKSQQALRDAVKFLKNFDTSESRSLCKRIENLLDS